ncbi:hypothetical protein FXB41_28035 [Bradyrhizobium canariense]|uniref:hypothetical protein n=1 Tax=Bradyrhizobium canariense TaxID=255045 RepID=UPI001CA48B1F|nr:hypothetical protein [Bradyrhizobium canariense]MBW5438473.1 hypothetical protein [Bradyrhizobium canariense]
MRSHPQKEAREDYSSATRDAMLKFLLALIFLLVGSIAYALIRKARHGGPLIEEVNEEPRSLRELAERRREDREAQQRRAGVQ